MGCGDDDSDEPEVDALVGLYSISSATLNEDLIVADTIVFIEEGSDLTEQISGALLAAAPCTDGANTRIELQDGGLVFYTCVGEDNTLENGTWQIDEGRTQLTLTLNIDPSPTPVPVVLTNLVESTSSVSGDIILPLSVELIDETGFLATIVPGGVLTFNLNISFTRG